jgi:diguanylate cyclase (GGDEF)-like protein
VLLLDLDGFKEVNDTLGHDAGDDLLVAVAGRLRAAVRPVDVVVRLGGDEFAVLVPGLSEDGAVALAQDIRAGLRRPIVVSGLDMEVDASVGVAVGPAHGTDLAGLLKRADVAMYDAKRTGAGVRVYDSRADPHEAEQLTVLGQLRRGIAEGQLRLHYQPKWTADGHIDEVEALVRWQHPQRGLLPPSAFVPLAERTTLIKPLTAWVLTEAARQCALWRATGQDLRVAVNVGARNLLNEDLVTTVRHAADVAHLPIDAIRLEITETAVMADPAHATLVLSELRALGVQVSIDDFGAGYTSLSYLTTLPAKALKIDKRFIDNLLSNELDEAVVRNVIQLAHDLGMVSVAEGVESHEAWERLVQLGCDEIQGYVLSRPLPPDQLIPWLETWRSTPDTPTPSPYRTVTDRLPY